MASDVRPSPRTSVFEFHKEHDGSLGLRSAIFQAIGAGSMCWTEPPHGIFKDDWARDIGEALMEFIQDQEQPLLGLATTRELLAELSTRIELDYFAGGGGLDYSTVKGRPEMVIDDS